MFGIRLEGAVGDITAKDNVVWRRQRSTPYVPSPLLVGEWLYFLNHYQAGQFDPVAGTFEYSAGLDLTLGN